MQQRMQTTLLRHLGRLIRSQAIESQLHQRNVGSLGKHEKLSVLGKARADEELLCSKS